MACSFLGWSPASEVLTVIKTRDPTTASERVVSRRRPALGPTNMWAPFRAASGLHFNAPWPDCRDPGDMDLQDAVVNTSLDCFQIHAWRQSQGPLQPGIGTFDRRRLFRRPMFGAESQHVAGQRDIEFARFEPGDSSAEDVPILQFLHLEIPVGFPLKLRKWNHGECAFEQGSEFPSEPLKRVPGHPSPLSPWHEAKHGTPPFPRERTEPLGRFAKTGNRESKTNANSSAAARNRAIGVNCLKKSDKAGASRKFS